MDAGTFAWAIGLCGEGMLASSSDNLFGDLEKNCKILYQTDLKDVEHGGHPTTRASQSMSQESSWTSQEIGVAVLRPT